MFNSIVLSIEPRTSHEQLFLYIIGQMDAEKTSNSVIIKKAELPVSCPMRADEQIWSKHPRVYIPLSEDKPKGQCPYCGQDYHLTNE